MTDRVMRRWHDEAQAARYRQQGIWADVTMPEMFDAHVAAHPDKPALIDDQVCWTYAELQDLSRRAAQLLLDLGVQPGDPVAVQLPTCGLLALIHLAANRVGAFMVAMPTRWRRAEVGSLLAAIRAELLISVEQDRDVDVRALHAEVRPRLPELREILYARTGAPASFEARVRSTTPLTAETERALRPDPDQPAHVMCSSGTAGTPKASLWSANDMITLNVRQTAAALELTSDDVAAAIAPAGQGSTGYIFAILTPLLVGATSAMLEHWTPRGALDLIVRHRCTYATAIPTQMVMMLELDLEGADLGCFTRFNNAGAPLPPAVAREIEARMGCRVQSVYGTTDGGVPTMTTIHDPDDARWETVGRAAVGEEIELRGPDGTRVSDGETGEVYWRGANNTWGYLNQPDYDQANWVDGWYRSGDLGTLDADGYLRIVGRAKDMILRGGMNVFPLELETALIRHAKVADVAIVPVPDRRLGEQACAVVVPADDPPTLAELTGFLDAEGFARFKLPEHLVLVDSLPTNPGGKVDKASLQQLATERTGRA